MKRQKSATVSMIGARCGVKFRVSEKRDKSIAQSIARFHSLRLRRLVRLVNPRFLVGLAGLVFGKTLEKRVRRRSAV